MARRVLVPMDGSPQSEHALEHALAIHPDAAVTVIHVTDPVEASYNPGATVPGYSEEWYDQQKQRAEELFDEARAVATDHGVEIDAVHEVGNPANVIVDYAESEGVDQIVMGCHGRSGVARVLLGSVAEAVVRRSPVPVTVVR